MLWYDENSLFTQQCMAWIPRLVKLKNCIFDIWRKMIQNKVKENKIYNIENVLMVIFGVQRKTESNFTVSTYYWKIRFQQSHLYQIWIFARWHYHNRAAIFSHWKIWVLFNATMCKKVDTLTSLNIFFIIRK